MEETKRTEQTMEECTHVCQTCHVSCDEKKGDRLTLEETLNLVSDMDSNELLKALEDF